MNQYITGLDLLILGFLCSLTSISAADASCPRLVGMCMLAVYVFIPHVFAGGQEEMTEWREEREGRR